MDQKRARQDGAWSAPASPTVRQHNPASTSRGLRGLAGRYEHDASSEDRPCAAAPAALERANAVRLARAELKRRVASGDISAAEVILTCPWEADTMTVSDLLSSQRRWGQTRCRRFLQAIPMSETKTVGTLTDRQRHAVAELLTAQTVARRPAPAPVRRQATVPAVAAAPAAAGVLVAV